jgi:hypothetical protein
LTGSTEEGDEAGFEVAVADDEASPTEQGSAEEAVPAVAVAAAAVAAAPPSNAIVVTSEFTGQGAVAAVDPLGIGLN